MAATAERRPAVTEREREEKAREKATKEQKEAKEASANVVCPRVIVTNKPAAPTTTAMAATVPRTTPETEKEEKATTEEKATKEVDATLACLISTAPPKVAPTTMAMAATAERRPVVTEKATKEAREKATKEAREKGARAKDANSNGQRDGAITTPAAPTTTVSAVSATNQATMIKSLLCTDATFDAS